MDDEFDEAREWIEKCRRLAPEDSQVKSMMEEYTAKTGESFGDIVSEEYVSDPEGKEEHHHEDDCHCHDHDSGHSHQHHGDEGEDMDGFEAELEAMKED